MEVVPAPTALAGRAPSRAADFLELTKPRITSLVLVTAAVGYAVGGSGSRSSPSASCCFMAGTALLCAGASALNQYSERDADARMVRTQPPPAPGRAHRSPRRRSRFGLALSGAGLACLAFVNPADAASRAPPRSLSYVLAYTPLKRVTSLCTVVGRRAGRAAAR